MTHTVTYIKVSNKKCPVESVLLLVHTKHTFETFVCFCHLYFYPINPAARKLGILLRNPLILQLLGGKQDNKLKAWRILIPDTVMSRHLECDFMRLNLISRVRDKA